MIGNRMKSIGRIEANIMELVQGMAGNPKSIIRMIEHHLNEAQTIYQKYNLELNQAKIILIRADFYIQVI